MRKKGGCFKTAKQASRLKNVSVAMLKHWETEKMDHNYCCHNEYEEIAENVVVGEDGLTSDSWRCGRRIIELGVLADGLASCKQCGCPLSLSHCDGITTHGLGSMLKIRCLNTQCNILNNIPTGKRHDRVWDVNTKLATAMVHAGVGETQINSILASLNIPPVSHRMLDMRQKEIGSAMEDVARKSVDESLSEELNVTSEKYGENKVSASVDAGWQKRGSGMAYNSLSGHCSMIGRETGKIIGYAVRSKGCRKCETYRSNESRPEHDCRKNWKGSAKAMEADMVVEMVKEAKQKGIQTGTLIGDDDASTISKLHTEVDPTIQKLSDKNHFKKIIGNSLYSLQKQHKELSNKVIRYIQKSLNYVLAQNKGNPDGIKMGLIALSHHPFGNHNFCHKDWCRFKENPSEKYKSLPYGRPLSNNYLQISLEDLFNKYTKQSDKLANLGSTQGNESFNKTVASKAPKAHHYSGSASLNYRVAAGVAQKNQGQQYLLEVLKKVGVSPGTYTHRLSMLRDIQARKRKAIAITRKAKLRRLELKAKKLQTTAACETREGTSYLSGVTLTCMPHQLDTVPIPPPTKFPVIQPMKLNGSSKFAFFDLETTGLERTSHIVQIAVRMDQAEYSSFVVPKKPITPSASRITKINSVNGQLHHEGKPVIAQCLSDTMDRFLEFLPKDKTVLVGHNIRSFDCPILLNALHSCGKLAQFLDKVCGFVDTLKLFKAVCPELSSYSQQSLVTRLLNVDYSAHDAREDVLLLQQLVNHMQHNLVPSSQFIHVMSHASFGSGDAVDSYEYSQCVHKNKPSLQSLITKKVISTNMARLIAGSGLNYTFLELAFRRRGRDGIESIFTEKCEGRKLRVTNSKKVIDSITQHFSKNLEE